MRRAVAAVALAAVLASAGCVGLLGGGSGADGGPGPTATGAPTATTTSGGGALPPDALRVTVVNADGEATDSGGAFTLAVAANTTLAGADPGNPGEPYVAVEVEGRPMIRTEQLNRSNRTELRLRLGAGRLEEFRAGSLSVTVRLMDADGTTNDRVATWEGSLDYDPGEGTFTIVTSTPPPTTTTTPPATTTTTTTTTAPARDPLNATVTVVRVIDGDSMEVRFPDGETDQIRLLGVDTPEEGDVSPGDFQGIPDTPQAREWLRGWEDNATRFATGRLDGEEVRIVTDPEADRRGGFGRLLVYLYHDGELFNRLLLEGGYARVFDSSFSREDAFLRYEREAYLNGTGVWGYDR